MSNDQELSLEKIALKTAREPYFQRCLDWLELNFAHPIYFKEALGKDGKQILIMKFRTMIHGAELDEGKILASGRDPVSGKPHNEYRVTPVGKILRKSHGDELLQIINLIKGDISLVGKRAMSETEWKEYTGATYSIYEQLMTDNKYASWKEMIASSGRYSVPMNPAEWQTYTGGLKDKYLSMMKPGLLPNDYADKNIRKTRMFGDTADSIMRLEQFIYEIRQARNHNNQLRRKINEFCVRTNYFFEIIPNIPYVKTK
jgi:hypothetical protein